MPTAGKKLLVYSGALPGSNIAFKNMVEDLASEMCKRDIGLVYGGGGIGLMGVLARQLCRNGIQVVGVIPTFLLEVEGHNDEEIVSTSLLQEVDSMHERKSRMLEICDAVIALPGGFGTLDELFEAITWKQLGLHNKPIGILNCFGYYDHLHLHIRNMLDSGFIKESTANLAYMHHDIPTMLDFLFNSEF